MEVCAKESQKRGLAVLFHEKPFAGINGNGKHANWSVGTDTGLNFFYPKSFGDARDTIYTTALACLSHGLLEYNELVRCSVAHAGNDHRLGAQEAPPAIISLYPGTGFEEHVDKLIGGAGELSDYKPEKGKADPRCRAAAAVEANVEDRNRTAPFPFCGNRFEFRASRGVRGPRGFFLSFPRRDRVTGPFITLQAPAARRRTAPCRSPCATPSWPTAWPS